MATRTLPAGIMLLEEAFLAHTHVVLHSYDPETLAVTTLLRPNERCFDAHGPGTLSAGVLAMLNDTATTECIFMATTEATGNVMVDLSTTFFAASKGDRLLEMDAVCDKYGKRLAFGRLEIWELEDSATAPWPEAGAPLRRRRLIATGRAVKAMMWHKEDDIRLGKPELTILPHPYVQTFDWAPRPPLPEAEPARPVQQREAAFRDWSHAQLQLGGAGTTLGTGTDMRLNRVEFGGDDGGPATVTFVICADHAVGRSHVRAGALAILADIVATHAIAAAVGADNVGELATKDLGLSFITAADGGQLMALVGTADAHDRRLAFARVEVWQLDIPCSKGMVLPGYGAELPMTTLLTQARAIKGATSSTL
jgi:acyl-coenzyme A thioesterase PaaI-like protein